MAENVKVCDVEPSLQEKIRKFRFRKETNSAAIMMKIDKDQHLVILDEEFEDCSIDELQEEVPASQPRFILYSFEYHHDDGRKSYPLCFIYCSPAGCKPEQQMMYAGSLKSLVNDAGLTKVFDVRCVEDMTEEWLREKLQFFR